MNFTPPINPLQGSEGVNRSGRRALVRREQPSRKEQVGKEGAAELEGAEGASVWGGVKFNLEDLRADPEPIGGAPPHQVQ